MNLTIRSEAILRDIKPEEIKYPEEEKRKYFVPTKRRLQFRC
jgi:hypothetical protein